jgi:hypothetical protein
MVKFSVETGKRSLHQNIISLLEQSELNASFEGNDSMNPISLVFSTENDDITKVIQIAEKLIKQEVGKSVAFRVVPEGELVYFKK